MTSNDRTPQSVLDAPTSTPVVVSEQTGQNRHGRRHVQYRPKGKTFRIPKAARQPATNVPHVAKEEDASIRPGKKAIRRALREILSD